MRTKLQRTMAHNIKTIRLNRGLKTQTALAEASGLTPAWINHFEAGRRTPSLKNAIKLSQALCVSLDELCLARQEREEK